LKKTKDPKAFIRIPGYPGGNEALEKFVKQNLKYPKEALEKRIEGSVQVDYDFNHKGKITKAIVSKGLGHGCDEEAIRLVKLLRYKNAKHRGLKVVFHKSINIHFRLPPQKQITYQFKQENKDKQESKNKGVVYSYTIVPGKKK